MVYNGDSRLDPYWYPVALDNELLDRPERRLINATAVVVGRIDGRPFAAIDRCPHRNARLSDGHIANGCLHCPYHGWQFDSTGTCVHVPAIGRPAATGAGALRPLATHVAFGLVWVALATPTVDLLAVPEWDDPTVTAAWLPPVTIRAGAAQFVDNFLDFAHFPFVHAGTFGSDDDQLVGDYQVESVEHGLRVRTEHVVNHHEDPKVATGEHPLSQPRIMEYTWQVPFAARLRLEYPVAGIVNTIAVWAVPETESTTVLYTVLLRNDVGRDDHAAIQQAVDYELSILAEDLRILERLPGQTLDLDPRSTMNTRADRITVEFRRVLAAHLASHPSPTSTPSDTPTEPAGVHP